MSWIYYLLEANFYLVVFYLLYYFIFRGETHYQLNRAYLLVSSLLAFIIPVVQLGFLRPELKVNVFAIGPGQVIEDAAAPETPVWTINNYLLAAYLLIGFVLLVNLAIKIYKLIRLSRINKNTVVGSYKLVEITGGNDAFSFFNYVFISRELALKQTVVHHELIHVRQKHSWDIIFFEILKIVNWFNPLVYYLQYSIKELHEFIADDATAAHGDSTDLYTNFLVNNAYGINDNILTNTLFNKRLLKQRIIMLHQKRSGMSARLKYLLALPVCAGLLCASTLGFSKTYTLIDLAPGHNEKAKNTTPVQHTVNKDTMKNEAKDKNKRMPEFPGGTDAFSRFLARNIHYPAAAREKHIQGRVIAKMIVEKDGSLSHITIARGVSPDLDNETIRVLNMSPKWEPGTQNGKVVATEFAVPVSFTLAPDQAINKDTMKSDAKIKNRRVPEFPGGTAAFSRFLARNIHYPVAAREKHIQGRVIVKMIVDKDGSLSHISIAKGVSEDIDKEAVRAMAMSPKWKPGTQKGKAVRSEYALPIMFTLSEE